MKGVKFKYLFVIGLIAAIANVGFGQSEEVKWHTLAEAIELSEKEPRKIFLDVMTVWCGWCKKMDREVFSQSTIVNLLNDQYYPVRLDAQQKEDIEFKGETFKYEMYGQKGFNRFAVELLSGKMGFPSLVFLDEDFNLIQSLEGYHEASRLALVLSYFGTQNSYKKLHWNAFVRAHESKLRQNSMNMNSLQQVGGKN